MKNANIVKSTLRSFVEYSGSVEITGERTGDMHQCDAVARGASVLSSFLFWLDTATLSSILFDDWGC